MGKDKILDMYSMILPVGNAKVFVDQIFRIFDKDGNGTIDFKVIVLINARWVMEFLTRGYKSSLILSIIIFK